MVKTYEGDAIEIRRFDKLLITSQTAGVNTWMFFGFVIGLLYILLYTCYALTFWQGLSMALELKNKNETPDILIVVNFCMQICFVNVLKIPIFFVFTKQAVAAFDEVSKGFEKNPRSSFRVKIFMPFQESRESFTVRNVIHEQLRLVEI